MNQQADSKEKLINLISEGLKAKPAYLLIFGICVLLFLMGAGAGFGAIVENNVNLLLPAFILIFLSFIAALLVSAYVIRIMEVSTRKVVEVDGPPDIHNLTGDKDFDNILAVIIEGLRDTLKIDDEVFYSAVQDQCEDFCDKVVNSWSNGHLMVREHQYNKTMLNVYSHAKDSVFCTSILDFAPTWAQHLGSQILNAHAKSNALVTRVFIFNNRSEVTSDLLEEMRKQNSTGNIKVRVYFDDEDLTFSFPPDISKDFSIIDNGKAISVTLSFGDDEWYALWYFKDYRRAGKFLRIRQSIIAGSESFEDFEKWARHVGQ